MPSPLWQQVNLPACSPHCSLKCWASSREAVNTNFKFIGLTWLGIEPESTAPVYSSEADAASTRPSSSERRFYDDHDRKVNGSTPSLVSLLRPWIRCFMMILSAWWNPASSKLKKSEENLTGKLKSKGQLLSESGFVLRIAPPPLSCYRRIKMKKSKSKERSGDHLLCLKPTLK